MVLDSETFYNNSLSTIATAAIAESHVYHKNILFLKYPKISLEVYTFFNDDI